MLSSAALGTGWRPGAGNVHQLGGLLDRHTGYSLRYGGSFWHVERFDDATEQGTRAYDLVQTGLIMLAIAVSLSAGSIFAGKLMAHFSTPTMMLDGLLIGTAGLLATSAALTEYIYLWVVSATMVAYGGGTALAIAPMTPVILSAASSKLAGTASGLLNTVRQTDSLLDVATAGTVVTVVPGLAHATPMVFGPMTLSYAGAMAMAWISRRPAATTLAA